MKRQTPYQKVKKKFEYKKPEIDNTAKTDSLAACGKLLDYHFY